MVDNNLAGPQSQVLYWLNTPNLILHMDTNIEHFTALVLHVLNNKAWQIFFPTQLLSGIKKKQLMFLKAFLKSNPRIFFSISKCCMHV